MIVISRLVAFKKKGSLVVQSVKNLDNPSEQTARILCCEMKSRDQYMSVAECDNKLTDLFVFIFLDSESGRK